jgi:hypothetical protein
MLRRFVFAALCCISFTYYAAAGITKPGGQSCTNVDCVTCFDESCGGVRGGAAPVSTDDGNGLLFAVVIGGLLYRIFVK